MKLKMTCRACGSETVHRDAWAEWDQAAQEWVLGTVFDAAHCPECDGECSIKETELA